MNGGGGVVQVSFFRASFDIIANKYSYYELIKRFMVRSLQVHFLGLTNNKFTSGCSYSVNGVPTHKLQLAQKSF